MNSSHFVGIWGFGKVGKAYLQLLAQQGYKKLTILDKRTLGTEEQTILAKRNVQIFNETTDIATFLEHNDFILASPGVDIRPYYSAYSHKFLNELDLFAHQWRQPVIAITGSIGKTTVTHLIGECLKHNGKKIVVGGNIGTPTAELLQQQENYPHGAVLEVSSFQLEHTQHFAPNIALFTTFVPNHLDRHTTEDEYFNAKYNIFAHQQPGSHAVVSASIAQHLRTVKKDMRSLHIIHADNNPITFPIGSYDTLWSLHNGEIIRQHNGITEQIVNLQSVSSLTFPDNLLMVVATLTLSGMSPEQIVSALSQCSLPAHRLELVAQKNGITFYNDSKSTTTTSTLAAVHQLQQHPIILLLGGLSKGVDRKPLITELKNNVKTVICFGAELKQLAQWCTQEGITVQEAATLQEAFKYATDYAQSGDVILLSPSGSSYDLFKDYQERGECFKQLVSNLPLLHTTSL